jgi:Flp pilus assembly protein TadD
MALGLGTLAVLIGLLAALGQQQVDTLADQGGALVAEGRYSPAVRVLSKAVAEAPGNARAHYYLGLAYAGLGLCGAASIHLGEAMRLSPSHGDLSGGLGACQAPAARSDVAGHFDHAVHGDR